MGRLRRGPALAVVLLAAACGSGRPAGTVASPASGAGPAQVVQALVDAVNARDATLAHTLTTDDFGSSLDRTWLAHGYLTDASVGEPQPGAGAGTAHTDAVEVVVTFTPRDTDGSMTDGTSVTWGFLLTDTATGWKVFDAGEG